MEKMDLIATTTFGLEAIAKRELIGLGYNDIRLENGKVKFRGLPEDIVRANIWLRTAERLLIQVGEFKAITFDELFEKTKNLAWEDYLPEDANFVIDGKSVNSKLFSISDCQRIVEKAIVERLKTKYPVEWFQKSGPRYRIEVSLLKDIATLTIDSSGEGLHKRGYRDRAGDAPIKETLAAAMVYLSFWNPGRVLLDPFCGAGTILIEAGMIGRNISPGLDRSFDAENFYFIDKDIWKNVRVEALKSIKQDEKLELLGADIDKRSILRARDNAAKVGLEDDISFFMKDMREIDLLDNYGVVITNPPYGERVGEKKEAELLYKDFGKKFRELKTWSIYTITSNKNFEKLYGKKADRKRKLYNGRIKVDYYQYYGPRPK